MRAARFLDRFRKVERETSPLFLFAEDSEGFEAAIADNPEELAKAFDTAAARVEGYIAEVMPGSFASAACDASGMILIADDSFRAWLGPIEASGAMVRPVAEGTPRLSMIAQDRSGRPVAIAAGDSRAAATWPLSAEVRAALGNGQARYALVAFRPDSAGWLRAARAHGFTRSEARLVSALIQQGDLRAAAGRAEIAYETARKLVASAMAKCGAARQTDLVREAMRLAAGDLRTPVNVDRLFADLFDLTLRQARVARGIASGGTRAQVANAMRISEHAVKSELKIVFVACGVETAVDLTRIVAEVDALAGLASACDVALNHGQASEEPLRIVARSWAAGQIAVADHGPAKGFPVVIFQVNTMSRSISLRFIAQLQAQGLRPIIFDRSGYGLTDHVEGDPYRTVTHDLADVLDALGCPAAILLSRGFASGAVTAAAALPERILGGVLLGPDPPVELDPMRSGMMGAGRAIFYDRPWLAEALVRVMARRTSSDSIARLMRESVADSPIDLAALDDPQEMAIIARSGRQAALGMRGFLSEVLAQSSGARAVSLPDGSAWTIAYGLDDPLYRFEGAAAEHWKAVLPGVATAPIEKGGRFLHLTHGETIARLCAEVLGRAIS
ncbi:alpha/beta fold hydrolase [Sphingomonas sp. LB-2]|uniref:alpha/beta fold hydrolase n=1 Tax=Sphingomonas caeni TaxID=2984949 RepID=UPI00223141DA|nr:alpha/beta fold hydrolase [Sphingomonas caeni]MCW3847764.1 alpha/beta fold hydrolase [Sphingomonas caeni]